ncbi:hypothetical protein GBF38_017151 [Nibea albiflora]|uniref:Uncharacterized protein n=1 Tax=Nibea albiflora TaxID=240163 RepID=A0ACB7EEV8_NIBAL|nr:hypothetical protein GBF38_017151 [Nibea albiflora]
MSCAFFQSCTHRAAEFTLIDLTVNRDSAAEIALLPRDHSALAELKLTATLAEQVYLKSQKMVLQTLRNPNFAPEIGNV